MSDAGYAITPYLSMSSNFSEERKVISRSLQWLAGIPVSALVITAAPLMSSQHVRDMGVARYAEGWTSSNAIAVRVAQPAQAVSRVAGDVRSLVRELRDRSGLTWDQLARLLQVSRRSLHHWAAGGRVNSAHHEAIVALLGKVNELAGSNAEERKAEIFSVDLGGKSHFQNWLAEATQGRLTLSGEKFDPGRLEGALHDRSGEGI